jgi:hypothetical protein
MAAKYQTESLAFLRTPKIDGHTGAVPTIDFTDDEHAAVTAVVRCPITDDRYPLSPRLAPPKSALACVGTKL